jgi:hypothetical protein
MARTPALFPAALDGSLRALATGHGLDLRRDTHYDVCNRELGWFDGSRYCRLDFDFDGTSVRVTHYVEIYPCLPRLWRLLRNTRCAKRLRRIRWTALGELRADRDAEWYREEIARLLARAMTAGEGGDSSD